MSENGEKKPGKNGITLGLEEFGELVKLVPKVQDSLVMYELRDTRIPSSSFELDLPVLDLDTVFLPSPPSQEPIPIIRNEELLDSQPKCPSSPLLIEPSLESIDENPPNKLKGKRKCANEHRKRATRSQKLKIVKQMVSLWGMLSYRPR